MKPLQKHDQARDVVSGAASEGAVHDHLGTPGRGRTEDGTRTSDRFSNLRLPRKHEHTYTRTHTHTHNMHRNIRTCMHTTKQSTNKPIEKWGSCKGAPLT